MPAGFRPAPFFRGLLAHRREMRSSTAGAASIETSNDIFNEVLCQSMADLNMLMTDTPQGRYPYAGIPWYSTTFGTRRNHHRAADAVVRFPYRQGCAPAARRLSGQGIRSARRRRTARRGRPTRT